MMILSNDVSWQMWTEEMLLTLSIIRFSRMTVLATQSTENQTDFDLEGLILRLPIWLVLIYLMILEWGGYSCELIKSYFHTPFPNKQNFS